MIVVLGNDGSLTQCGQAVFASAVHAFRIAGYDSLDDALDTMELAIFIARAEHERKHAEEGE